ncbi:MAG TPA: F420-nonreducing hydrogenase [Bryobacteraceae bacterium]|nr:F420-nonreducing hydrogenase [Bryobacteraceae bacterium]HOL72351.1 F420-nonreducing hydrogenase [Bryobacteraceae bacterium]HOQ45919.1 F420-nonreducing hydrogenase [Bryobacteraceae bacterium]HPQ14834.1 F420-nonreducing hydrogenase [Bryobacteraceae bacterium]HPU73262.1 F420-nonreducing hydrogenase [Bryobacteraceae bacterium]
MKPKVAFYWCASCGGCEESSVDLGEALLDVAEAIDIVLWPVALDFKKHHIEAMADGEIVAAFINGAVRSSEQEEWVHLLRKKSQVVIAFGSCAQLGGIPGLANFFNRAGVLEAAYRESPSTVNPNGVFPQTVHKDNGFTLTLPVLHDTVRTLDQVIDVDYYIPGCPPTPQLLADAVQALLSGKLPPKGAVLAPDHALCKDCPRRDTKPEKPMISEFKRPHEVVIDQTQCLLNQGLLCLGPATRSGCGALCIEGNMPCTGCFGPTSRVRDYGAKALSAIASMADSNDDAEIAAILSKIPDPAGTFYRYSLPASALQRKKL